MEVKVCVLSGQSATLKVLPESLLAEVKVEAQELFQCNFLRLNSEKRDLVMNKSLKELGVEDGEILMATLQWPQIAATQRGFALWCHHGGIITWGTENSKVPIGMAEMQQLTQVEATGGAFAGLADGKVVTGSAVLGGDSGTRKSWLVFKRFGPHKVPLPPSVQMDKLLLRGMQKLEVSAIGYGINYEKLLKFIGLMLPLLRW